MELSGFINRSGPFTNNISGGCFTMTREHAKGIAVFLREFGKASQREGAYELSFEGKYDITRLGRKEGNGKEG